MVGLPGDTIELRSVELVIGGKPVSYAPLDAEITNQLSAAEQRRDSSPPND